MLQFNDIRRLAELDFADKRVLVRADLDQPARDVTLSTWDNKVDAAVPTLHWLLERGVSPTVVAHAGPARAKPRQSLESAAARLAELLEVEVYLPEDHDGRLTEKLIAEAKPGRLVMLENLAWDQGEFDDSSDSAARLCAGVDVFIADAFDPSATSSLARAAKLCPERAMGLHLEAELVHLSRVLDSRRAVWCIGDGFAERRDLLRRALELTPTILAGTHLARTLLAATGKDIPIDARESEWLPEARTWLQQARDSGTRVVLPRDLSCGSAQSSLERSVNGLQPGEPVLDLGSQTVAEYTEAIAGAETIMVLDGMGSGPHALEATRALVASAAGASGYSYVVSSQDLRVASMTPEPGRLSFISTSKPGVLAVLRGQRVPALEALRFSS
jgi:phosphoglycerate kinase